MPIELTPSTFALRVIARTKDAIYLRLSPEVQRPIEGGCDCEQCKRNPALAKWDTLCVPIQPIAQWGCDTSHTVHMPDVNVEQFLAQVKRTGYGLPPVKK